ncbi:MAG: bifunctional UDP-sugar hydrolase/5'-nucleotidase [Thermodesulfobacteriota bacterium]|nr:bifunctional UDP-sugar hydrolase/5'-nucleotidase [Thermodesulfobacteriota bacterium]
MNSSGRRIRSFFVRESARKVVITLTLALFMFVPAGMVGARTAGLTILHLNDIHGYIQADRITRCGGLAKAAALIKSIKAQEEPVLYLIAGDVLEGTALSELTQGRLIFDALNLYPPEACCLGNHEFGYGIKALKANLARAKYKILSANTAFKGQALAEPYVFLSAGPLRVAVLGLTVSLNSLVKRNPGLSFEDPEAALGRLAPRLAGQADLLVLLTHLGLEQDKALARLLPGLFPGPAVIVGGHSHDLLVSPLMVGPVPVVQAGAYARHLGRLDLVMDLDKKKLVSVSGKVLPIGPDLGADTEITALAQDFYRNKGRDLLTPVAHPTRTFSEAEIAALAAQAVRETTGAALGMVNLGGFRAKIRAGTLYRDDLVKVFPFNNQVLQAKMPGWAVKRILEKKKRPSRPGRGLVFRPPNGPGPLDPARFYSVAGNDYLMRKLAASLGLKPDFQVTTLDLREFLGRTLAEKFPLVQTGQDKRSQASGLGSR